MWNNLLIALEIMGKGMGGIFVVVLIITVVVMLLSKLKYFKTEDRPPQIFSGGFWLKAVTCARSVQVIL